MKKFRKTLRIYLIITAGSILAALGVGAFLSPLKIVAGGLSGIGTIIRALTGFPIGTFMILADIPLFLIGIKFLGGSFGIKSIYGASMLSVFIDVFSLMPPITGEPILASIVGGVLLGMGMGMVFITGASTGGTDIVAKLGNRLIAVIDVGKWLFIFDFVIISASGIIFDNYELCLYGIIALAISSFLIDYSISGMNSANIVYIVSRQHSLIASEILKTLDRGLTGIYAKGMYNNNDLIMLMCVVKRRDVPALKKMVKNIDENAFIILSAAREVAGEGFKIYPIT